MEDTLTTSVRRSNPQGDLFSPLISLPIKDQREVMERPFFSLQKRKRVKPIEYTSPDGETWVKVEAIAAYGMATIWDADILIWAASVLNQMREQGINDLPRTLKTTTGDLLRAIQRDTSGRAYQRLQEALQRLQTTSISTSIRSSKRRQKTGFNWLDKWTLDSDPVTDAPRGMSITLSDWMYEGIVSDRALLTLHPDYFCLTGGLERVLYRIARKHVGTQSMSWKCRLSVLQEKVGSDCEVKEFARSMRKIALADALPEYSLSLTDTKQGEPAVTFSLKEGKPVGRKETKALLAAADRHAEAMASLARKIARNSLTPD